MNGQISKSESEIVKNNALIERKQTQIDQLNKRIDLHISKLDGVGNVYRKLSDCTIRVFLLHVCCISSAFALIL